MICLKIVANTDNYQKFIEAVGKSNAKPFCGYAPGSIIVSGADGNYPIGSLSALEVTVSFSKISTTHLFLGEDGKCTCGQNQCTYEEVDIVDLFRGDTILSVLKDGKLWLLSK
jgi:hypothetical protein